MTAFRECTPGTPGTPAIPPDAGCSLGCPGLDAVVAEVLAPSLRSLSVANENGIGRVTGFREWASGTAPEAVFSGAVAGKAITDVAVVLGPSKRKGGPKVVLRGKFVPGGRNNALDPMLRGCWLVVVEGYIAVAVPCAGIADDVV